MTLTSPTDEIRMTRAEFVHTLDQKVNEEINRVLDKIRNGLVEASTIGQHTIDVFDELRQQYTKGE